MLEDTSVQAVIRNLKDAGCNPETVKEFLALDGEGKIGEQLKLLDRQRQQLLEQIHREETCIDCLDYLVHKLNKKYKSAL